ncbi:transcriptional regulator with XRE-family HTH domain [Desulfofundulus luciae]|uniref:Transcriptional regulator with XRE-family HTH domain n=1 Tax=Desulfofundulus luciae TaxID=74702 RepID=A0ABU0B641_9FIRM|nr:helix-turn-helix transcriptional regulator [Desulfofundulus luciae]MDQ0287725.1 transcriptional regulator with XRE-family HTH domain [Desulfofundulus luciae]
MTDDIKVAVGMRIKEIRLALGMSQEELAFKSGLHRTYISSIERGERNISIINIQKISRALGVRPKDLLP